MKISTKLNRIIVLIVLPAISWLFFNSVYYRHLHELSSGLTISHAHPYDKAADNSDSCPFSSHNHTEDEYILYDVISNTIIPVLFGLLGLLAIYKPIVEKKKLLLQEKVYQSESFTYRNYRGPPVKF